MVLCLLEYIFTCINLIDFRSASWIPGDLRKGEDKPLMGMSEIVTGEDRTTFCGCIPCATETADTLNEMLDFSLLKDPIFIIFTVSNFCTSIGFNVPYVYMVVSNFFKNLWLFRKF